MTEQVFAALGIAATGFALGCLAVYSFFRFAFRSRMFWRAMVKDTDIMYEMSDAINEAYDEDGNPRA